jgi:hypothetical protein
MQKDQYIHISDTEVKYYFKDREMTILHRVDGPAVVFPNGSQFWYQNGKLHREDGPAVDQVDRCRMWYQNGRRHREDGPAVVYDYGTKEWYRYGQLHREDGPAVVNPDGLKEWYLRDVQLTQEEYDIEISNGV